MRVFHFVNKQHGLENIQRRRLKIAQIDDLNDPFELRSFSLADARVRAAFEKTRAAMALDRGMVCFSKSWSNPVQWSHYADRHRGLCLGFDVPDELLNVVKYQRKPIEIDLAALLRKDQEAAEVMQLWFTTKYSHWRYEREVRVFANLEDRDPETGLYFADFSEQMQLRQVIVGANSDVSRADLVTALKDQGADVRISKSRLAFRSFRVVRQRAERLWS